MLYHCVNLDHDRINSTWVVTHEVGHHLGLPHTFQGDCSEPNDGIDDTPQHNESGLWSCNPSQDTCPSDPGNDPVTNYMNYSGYCQTEYSPGQHYSLPEHFGEFLPTEQEHDGNVIPFPEC